MRKKKVLHAGNVVDSAKVSAKSTEYKPIPSFTDFTDENGNDSMKEQIQTNYSRIKDDVRAIVDEEIKRISDDPDLSYLIKK